MEPSAIAVILGLGAAAGWGVGDFWAAKATRIMGPITAAFLVNAIGATAFIFCYVLFLWPEVTAQVSGVLYAIAGGGLITTAMLLFYKALSVGPVSVVSPISASYPLVTTLLALLVFQASISAVQLGAIALIIAGVMAAAGIFNHKRSERTMARGPLLAMASAFFYGTSFACIAQATERMDWQFTTLIQVITALIVFACMLPFVSGKEHVLPHARSNVTNRFVFWSGIFGMAALLAVNIGFGYDQTDGAVITTVSACYPALTILLALKHFKEEIKVIPLLGAAASITGVVILSLA